MTATTARPGPATVPVGPKIGAAIDWPGGNDFKDALQNPAAAFVDPALRTCKVERNALGVPKARSGAFASVYKLTAPDGKSAAVRVFNYPNEERQKRYDTLSRHLTTLGRRPDFLVDFRYTLRGIRLKGGEFPIQTMDWVEGVPLGVWYNARMQAKDAPAVRKMADDWQALVLALAGLKIAHGDLQHGNVMVRADRPVLVDYDGMCVPALQGEAATEAGLPAYQHPERGVQKLGLDLDHFSAWVVLIALRASAADPALYRRFVLDTENENMLFCPADMANPAGSALWPELLKLADPEVRGWATDLRASLDRPFARIPPFQADPFAALRDLCAAAEPDWEGIQTKADDLGAAGKTAGTLPAAVQARITEARRRVAARAVLRAALQAFQDSGDPRPVAAAFDPAVYAGWPKHDGLVKQARRAVEKGARLAELVAADRSAGNGRTLLTTWDRVKAELADLAAAKPCGDRAEAWRGRIAAADAFLRIVVQSEAAERTVADAWAKVAAAGPPHPDLTPAHAARGAKAADRAVRLDVLRSIPSAPSESGDGRLVARWDEAVFAGCPEADPFRPRVAAARVRLAVVAAAAAAVQKADAGAGTEAAVAAAAAGLPADYEYALRGRVALARDGEQRFAGLKAALTDPAPSDVAIADAWKAFQKDHPKHAALLDPARRGRCELAVRRRKTLVALKMAKDPKLNEYQQDVGILAAWAAGKAEMAGSADLPKVADRVKLADVRVRAWDALERVVKARDLAAVRAAAAPPGLTRFADYPPVKAARPQIDDLIRLADRVAEIRAKLQAARGGAGMPLTADDLAFLRAQGAVFDEKTKQAVKAVLDARLWGAVNLRPSPTPYQSMPGPMPMAKVFWTWSGFGMVSWFEVATSPAGPLAAPADAARDRISRSRPEDHQREGGGKLVVLGPGANVVITIWPVLDLGWATLCGPPVHIGPVRPGGR